MAMDKVLSKANGGCVYMIHPIERSRCFVFDKPFEVAKFIERQNQSVQLRLYLYVCLSHLNPFGLSAMERTLQI